MPSTSIPIRPTRHRPRKPLPPLLTLPLELRQQIYASLLPRENVSHPLPSVGITSVSHRPPTSAYLNIHPTITDEILYYFYTISTWKLVFSHAFNFFRVDPELRKLEQSPSLGWIRRVEVVFFCDVLLLHNYPSFGISSFCAEIARRASRAVDVLSQAKKLHTVIVSWCDSTNTGNWEEKAKILSSLSKLAERKPDVKFQVGKIQAEDVDQKTFAEALQNVLGKERRLQSDFGSDGTEERSEELRTLAFDVRQERLQINGGPGGYPRRTTRRSGWRGAPPLLAAPAEEMEEADEEIAV